MFDKHGASHPIARLIGAAFVSLLWSATSATALSVGPDDKPVVNGATDVGASYGVGWTQSIGGGLPSPATKDVWGILGVGSDGVTLGLNPTSGTSSTSAFHTPMTSFGAGTSQSTTGLLKSNGGGTLSDAISNGGDPKQSLVGGATDMATIVSVAAFGADSAATLASLPIKSQSTGHPYETEGQVSTVPLPATLPLLAAALIGLGILGKRRAKAPCSDADA